MKPAFVTRRNMIRSLVGGSLTMPAILHLLGFDHERLAYRHAGRDFRLTDVSGNVVKGVLS